MATSSRSIGQCFTLLATMLLLMSPAASASTDLPPEMKVGAIVYVSGGIGSDEIAAMKAAAQDYPLEVVFVARDETGHETYLAGNPLTIRDDKNQILLDTRAEGPFLLARLPAGTYRISATYQDQVREHRVAISARQHRRVVFVW